MTRAQPPVYDEIGAGYTRTRRADPRIEAAIVTAIGDARTLVNVGAGAGAYEPRDRRVVAVEPSAAMVRQRPASAAACTQAIAERLPFRDAAFDACLAVLTVHHWKDQAAGLAELRRVARRRVVVLTWDPASHARFWLTTDYFPEFLEIDRPRFPSTGHARRGPRTDPDRPAADPPRLSGWIPRRVLATAGGLSRPRRARCHLDVRPARPRARPAGRGAASPMMCARVAGQRGTARYGAESLDLGYRLIIAERGSPGTSPPTSTPIPPTR